MNFLVAGSHFDKLMKAVIAEAFSDFECSQYGGPPVGEHERHLRVLDMCFPDKELRSRKGKGSRKWADVLKATAILNGRWDQTTVCHHCITLPNGEPCCGNVEEAKKKA